MRLPPASWGWAVGREPPPWRPTPPPSGPTLNGRCHGSESLTTNVSSIPKLVTFRTHALLDNVCFTGTSSVPGLDAMGQKDVTTLSFQWLNRSRTDRGQLFTSHRFCHEKQGWPARYKGHPTGAAVRATTPSGSPGGGSTVQTGSLGHKRTLSA